MAKLIETKTEMMNGQLVVVKVYAPDRSDRAGCTKPRFSKRNMRGALYCAIENGLKLTNKKEGL